MRTMKYLACLALCVALCFVSTQVFGQSIIAVDPGSNFMKVVLVQPGKVFDIALSPDSKRKTYTGIGIVDGVRAFGSESFNVYGKKPQNTVWRVRDLIGRSPMDPDLLKTLQRNHLTQHRLLEAEDGTGAIRIEFAVGTKDAQIFSPEELFAMILTHCKENGERHGITRVSSVALTVPMFFDQARRQGLVDATEIAGLSLMALVDENGGAAIQYALDRSFNETAQNLLFFNMGASSTQVSVVQITGGKDKRTSKEFRNIRVLSKAWDEDLGVEDFDLALAALFAKEFDEKHPSTDNKIVDAPRAIVRLKKEGRQVKEILSGLEKFPVQFQALHRDVDFKSVVTRQQMEDLGQEVLQRVKAPVERALKYAGLSAKDLHMFEVVGGGFRVPGVRDALKKLIPEGMDLSTHVNGDEGMVFGAAFVSANVSSTFHVPRVATYQDCVPREVRLKLTGADLDRDVPLFQRFAPTEGKEPTRQVIKFRHNKDFTVRLLEMKAVEDDAKGAPDTKVAAQFDVSGITGALAAFGKFGEPKIHLTFTMDRSMMLSLATAEAKFEEEYEEKPKNSTSENATEEAAVAAVVKKTRKHVFTLTVKRTDLDVPVKRMTAEIKLKAMQVLTKMDEQDKARSRKEEARNGLEAFSFVSREKLSSNEEQVKKVLDEADLEELMKELAGVEDWIDDNKRADAEAFVNEKKRLQARVDKVFYLIKESEERPAAIKAFKRLVNHLEDRRGNWTLERPWIQEAVWKVVDKTQEDARKWLQEMETKQSKLTMKQDPVLSLSALRAEMEKIQKLVELLLKQRKPAPQQATVNKKTTSKPKSEEEDGNQQDTKGEEAEKTAGEKEEETVKKTAEEEQASEQEPVKEEL